MSERTITPSLRTTVARAAVAEDCAHGAVMPPLHLSSNFTFAALGEPRHYDYTRSGNPTRDQLASALAELEHAAGAVVTATGMAAITTILQRVSTAGRVVAPRDCYGGTHRLLRAFSDRERFALTLADFQDLGALEQAITDDVELIWIETPSNPLLRLTDIAAVAALAKRHGALVAVDNTFLSPVLQQPLTLGADVIVHSTTKYLNGHSDVVGGAVLAADPALHEEFCWWANCLGVTGAPFDAWLTLRGLRTLPLRMVEQEASARALLEVLVDHPAVQQVHHPSLPSHPQHELARIQQRGFGAMISFELAGGLSAVRAFVEELRAFSLAESLGGVESLVAHPASMTHAAMGEEARRAAGIGDGLVRLSVGIEDPVDLGSDLRAGLERAMRVTENLHSTSSAAHAASRNASA